MIIKTEKLRAVCKGKDSQVSSHSLFPLDFVDCSFFLRETVMHIKSEGVHFV